ncbi:MFS transporter [Jatrophihabitans sp.]|uniref:MFS transporter n=1 Tax=Jatrophihabitans sp. TaxID=1932789 RepID=UPI002BBB4DF3|nr:MFS transporter [Jatrophihabitans sp.]
MTTSETAPVTRSSTSLFWRYWTASAVSEVGSGVTLVALPLIAITLLDASAFQISLLTAMGYLGWITLGLPAGVIVGRLPLRGLQVGADVVRAVAIGSLPVLWWLDRLTFAHLLLAAAVISLATVLFDVATATFLPAIVDKSQLTARNSLVSGTYAVTQLSGPSLGGLMVQALGAAPALLVDSVSFLFSGAVLRTLPERRTPPVPAASIGSQIRDGWRFVRSHPVMFPCVVWATAINFTCGALLALTPVYLVRDLGASPAAVGLLMATEGIGAVIGSWLTPRLERRFGGARVMLTATFTGAALALLMPLLGGVPGALVFSVGNAGFAAGVVMGSIITRTHRQTASPPHLLARVMATVRFVSWSATPVGSLVAGGLAVGLGTRAAFWLSCASAFLGPVLLLRGPVPGLHSLSDLEPADAEEAR